MITDLRNELKGVRILSYQGAMTLNISSHLTDEEDAINWVKKIINLTMLTRLVKKEVEQMHNIKLSPVIFNELVSEVYRLKKFMTNKGLKPANFLLTHGKTLLFVKTTGER